MRYLWGCWLMKSGVKFGVVFVSALALASCGGGSQLERPEAGRPGMPQALSGPEADYPVKIGEPYVVGGVTYTPNDTLNYDEVGYASYYGPELAGRATARGEMFNPDGISGAHKTLPLPSYVEVTALDTGKTILVRLNDRGPFANDRLIDLSLGAARQLGIEGQGTAAVRVRRVNPPESERQLLRSGQRASDRIETPQGLLTALRRKLETVARPSVATAPMPRPMPGAAPAPTRGPAASAPSGPAPSRSGRFIIEGGGAPAASAPAPAPRPVVAAPAVRGETGYVVQIGSFGSQARAEELARRSGARAERSADGKLWRVRFGPYASTAEAEAGLAKAQSAGYGGARILKQD